jgi:putative ABC transport system permease protein
VERIFGIPVGPLAVVLAVTAAAALGAVAVLALRNRVFLRLGLRNATRRRSRTALVVLGLMLGTAIVAAAMGTGDTIALTVRSTVLESLGETDEVVSVRGADTTGLAAAGEETGAPWLDESVLATVDGVVAGSALVDGVAPAVVETVAVLDETTRQAEPRLTLFASDPERFASVGTIEGTHAAASLGDLAAGEAYLDRDAADDLGAGPGDRLRLLAGERAAVATVRDVVELTGAGSDGGVVVVPLAEAQRLLGKEGEIDHVFVSNAGDDVGGAALTDEVVTLLEPALAPLGLEADPVKQDGLELADAEGGTFVSLFTTFGMFSIAAGILLVFLIFVMLAAERRTEMGIARAIGTRRSHLVQMFVYEGAMYDVVAALVGAVLGVGVAYGMVLAIARAFSASGLDIRFDVQARSLVVAYCLGILVTLLVVAFSAWRVSILDVAAAIRDLPGTKGRRRRRAGIAAGLVGAGLGVLLAWSGLAGEQATPFLLGVSLVVVALVPLLRALGVSDRVTFTGAGLAIVVWWLLPMDVFGGLLPELGMDFSVWIAGGLALVVGATWLLVYNSDALLGALMAVGGRVRALAPVLKMAAAYPLRSRFRTGVTLAMFTLVVFTLVTGVTIFRSFLVAMDDVEAYGGGFEVGAVASGASPVGDLGAAIRETASLDPGDYRTVAGLSLVPVEARQAGDPDLDPYPLRGADDAFLETTTWGFAARAEGYETDEEVWRALARTPGLAVVDGLVVPRRANWGFAVRPDFALSGFYLEDETFAPVAVTAQDPRSGAELGLTVIGVLADTVPLEMAGLLTSQETLAPLGDRAQPTLYLVDLAPGADAREAARALEAAFLANGLEADAMEELLDEAVGASVTFNRLMQGFMGLGLVVGVAALGVISARSVVERRQQIGVLRAIGFQRSAVQLAFLLESAFVAVASIVAGTALGLAVAFSVIEDTADQPSWAGMQLTVPWLDLAVVFAVVVAACLAAAYVPARRGSRVYPAQALRYE